ncbi:MAG: hypothetical protein N2688_02595 [Burkholderiaceae bacterium]|nr:hypothetical protein [Burkholderiaceae bacterium]
MAARLFVARAAAWALLVTGWIGLGAFAFRQAPSVTLGFAVVALWLLALGAAATVATRGDLSPALRSAGILSAALAIAAAMPVVPRGGGLPALAWATLAWAVLTALASGVVRQLRLAQAARPRPPVAAAAAGAILATVMLGDIDDLPALSVRLQGFVAVCAALLVSLPWRAVSGQRSVGCRAGLFDCALPAWPQGMWRDVREWPVLLAGLTMLPMMAALPLMAAWCRVDGFPPQMLVLAHVTAMFVPALALQPLLARFPGAALAWTCALLLSAGAAGLLTAPPPYDWLALALAHGASWSLAWSGALWSPQRRAQQGSSPLAAAAGYALLTLGAGVLVERLGARGVAALHIALALAAMATSAWAGVRGQSERARNGAARVSPYRVSREN